MVTSKKLWNNAKEKLTGYVDGVLELAEMVEETKSEKVTLRDYELSQEDENQLRDLIITLNSTMNKWGDLYKKFKGKKPSCLDQIKPCCIFSFYGIILKVIYSINNYNYSSKLWLTYLKCIKKEWDERRTCNW